MSGYSEEIVVHRGILEQGIHFIEKGFTAQSLSKKVQDVLDGLPAGKHKELSPEPAGAKAT